MSESKKIVAEWTLIIGGLIGLALFLSSCSANHHLKRSQKHYQKAISKGYQPLNDTVKTAISIKPVSVTISQPNRTLIVNRIDSILKVNNCLDTLILSDIMKVVDTVVYYYELDTTLTAPNGAKVRIQFKNGAINTKWDNIDLQPVVYVDRLPYWFKFAMFLVIIVLLFFVVRWIAKGLFL